MDAEVDKLLEEEVRNVPVFTQLECFEVPWERSRKKLHSAAEDDIVRNVL